MRLRCPAELGRGFPIRSIVLISEFAAKETCGGMGGVGILIGFEVFIAVRAGNIFRNERGMYLSKVVYPKRK
ncbi:hypothetical protein CCP3SC1_120051 [Gammaproteobacteria bacterium]